MVWVTFFNFLLFLLLFLFCSLGAANTEADKYKQNCDSDSACWGPNRVIGLINKYFLPRTQRINVLHLIAKLKFAFLSAWFKLGDNYNSVSPLRLNDGAHSGLTISLNLHRGFVTTVTIKHVNINFISNLKEGSNSCCCPVELLCLNYIHTGNSRRDTCSSDFN